MARTLTPASLDPGPAVWATQAEIDAHFFQRGPSRDFLVRDEWDNGEFLTGATDLIEYDNVVHTETFVASSEDAPGPGFSAYGNGRDNHAGTQAPLVRVGVDRGLVVNEYEIVYPFARAEAETFGGALLAARPLATDYAICAAGARQVQHTVLITRDGRYDGAATTEARRSL